MSLLVAALICIIACIVFRNFLFYGKAYFFTGVGSDTLNYFYPFVYGVSAYIAKHGIPAWSFHFGMGQGLFPFCLRDPFDIFFYIAGKDAIIKGMVYKELAKILLGGLVFFYYLRLTGLSGYVALLGALLFAFSGFMIVGGLWYIFSFEAFNVALLLLSFELLFTRQKWYLFPVPVFLFAISQPFNLYLYGLFIGCYALLRMFQAGTFTIKKAWYLLLKMAGLYVLGMLCGAPFLIGNIVQLLESPRGSGANSYFHALSSAPVFALIDKLQAGTDILRFFSNDLTGNGSFFNGYQNYLEAPYFYCGLPCLLLMPQVFRFLDTRLRAVFIFSLTISLLPVVFPYFRHALWLFIGEYYRGYSFFVAFLFLYYALLSLNFIVNGRKLSVPVLVGTLVILFILLYYPYFPDKGLLNFPEVKTPDPAIVRFVSIMLITYSVVLYLAGQQYIWARYVFLALVVFELAYLPGITVNNIAGITKADMAGKKGYNDYTTDAVSYLKRIDPSFYRIDKVYSSTPARFRSYNDGLVQDYMPTCAYNQANQLYYIRYLQLTGVVDKASELDTRWAFGLAGRPMLEAGNRVKYLLTKNGIQPFRKMSYDSLCAFGDVSVFRNKYVLPFGYTYTHYITENVYDKLSDGQKDRVSLQACVVKDADTGKARGLTALPLTDTISAQAFTADIYRKQANELSEDTLAINKFEETLVTGQVTAGHNEMMYLSIPYDEGWELKVDGHPQEKTILSAGMTGVMLARGSHTIEMAYHLRYFWKGLLFSILGVFIYIGLAIARRK